MLLKEGLPIDDYAVFYRHHGWNGSAPSPAQGEGDIPCLLHRQAQGYLADLTGPTPQPSVGEEGIARGG